MANEKIRCKINQTNNRQYYSPLHMASRLHPQGLGFRALFFFPWFVTPQVPAGVWEADIRIRVNTGTTLKIIGGVGALSACTRCMCIITRDIYCCSDKILCAVSAKTPQCVYSSDVTITTRMLVVFRVSNSNSTQLSCPIKISVFVQPVV